MSGDREVTPLERVIDILADARQELAADNAAADEVQRRRDLERVLGDQSIAQAARIERSADAILERLPKINGPTRRRR